jgi:hypothetical protein
MCLVLSVFCQSPPVLALGYAQYNQQQACIPQLHLHLLVTATKSCKVKPEFGMLYACDDEDCQGSCLVLYCQPAAAELCSPELRWKSDFVCFIESCISSWRVSGGSAGPFGQRSQPEGIGRDLSSKYVTTAERRGFGDHTG